MALSFEIQLAVDELAMEFGWNNLKRLWIETNKFRVNLDSAVKDYTRSGLVSPKKLIEYVKLLKTFPDPYEEVLYAINSAIRDLANASFGDSVDEMLYGHNAGELEDALKGHRDENAWNDFETAHDCEMYEAMADE